MTDHTTDFVPPLVERTRFACHDCDWTSDSAAESYRHEGATGHFTFRRPRIAHECAVYGYGFQFYWNCSCGKGGKPTTEGRATAGRDRHLRSIRDATS